MPTYGYRCTECKTEFERFQKMTDPPVTECPNCGGPVKKLLYPVGIQFKGDGFYVNDYAKSDKGKTSTAASGESSGDTKTEATTESKPETKTDSAPASPAPTTAAASTGSDSK